MPAWASYVGGAAAFVIAVGVLWNRVIHPLIRAAAKAEEALPVLNRAVEVFSGAPLAFVRILAISEEFKSDGGSTLRDAINKLEKAIDGIVEASNGLKAGVENDRVGAEADRRLAERDRQELQRAVLTLDRLIVRTDQGLGGLERMEAAGTVVADNLRTAQTAVDGVAADLAASHLRADDASGQSPGEAGDAAARSASP